jgi:hypothetical protein
VRQAHGPEQDGVGVPARLEGRPREGIAGIAVDLGPGRVLIEPQAEAADPAQRGVQHLEARRHHLLPDAVAGQHRDAEGGVRAHFVPSPDRKILRRFPARAKSCIRQLAA